MAYASKSFEKGNKRTMANKPKKFYWLKLSESFFTSNTYIKKMRRMENGSELALIYLRLQTFSLKTDGIIHFKKVEENLVSLPDR